MSNAPEFELDLDLQLLPSWARQSPSANPFSHHKGEDDHGSRGDGKSTVINKMVLSSPREPQTNNLILCLFIFIYCFSNLEKDELNDV